VMAPVATLLLFNDDDRLIVCHNSGQSD
jgi:hypothetical protein